MTQSEAGALAPSSRSHLTPSLRRGLRAVSVAGLDFEPFVDWIVSPDVVSELVSRGLAEGGPSSRPSVGAIGYRLTADGWNAVQLLRRGRNIRSETH